MEIIHVSAECYPVAKVGGLGDVVGALPKYQNKLGHIAKVVMPMYLTKYLYEHQFEVVHKGSFGMGPYHLDYTVIKEVTNHNGFDLYLVDIFGLLDRENVYSYDDDTFRFLSFQIAVTDWISHWRHHPDVVHVHDHHTALIPFMMQNCFDYRHLAPIKTVLTIHNAQYQGWMGWDMAQNIPSWDQWKWGLLDWDKNINSLACGIKCASKVNTVSNGYLEELMRSANGLEFLFNLERQKCYGIVNGIDTEVWNPTLDSYIESNFEEDTIEAGKLANKQILCNQFNLDINKPLIVFIGRLVEDKGADLLPAGISDSIIYMQGKMNFLVLGSGNKNIESSLDSMSHHYFGYYNSRIGYNEKLAHQMYAGADFLLMPSRVEPCGLNQLYALAYGTMPMVRRTGGLKDTVKDIGEEGGFGICFNDTTVGEICHAVYRAINIFDEQKSFALIRKRMLAIDHSWEKSAEIYLNLYKS
ncbi:MAG: glycogen/starch synthase [Bacteroidetes bacterium]|nr:glycogen/starch synthase [Bacteroidota bacterium]